MYGYIYKTTNLVNGKFYIGQHKYDKYEVDPTYFGSGLLLKESIKKYGIENFSVELLDKADSREELNNKEIYYISQLNARQDGYNLTDGGDGAPNLTEESRLKMKSMLGKHHSEKSNKKRSESLKKVQHSKEWAEKIAKSLKGRKQTEEQKALISSSKKGLVWYNNGAVEQMFAPTADIPQDFKRGRLNNPFPSQVGINKSKEQVEKMRISKRQMRWYTNGLIEKMFKEDEVPEGFIKGRLKHI